MTAFAAVCGAVVGALAFVACAWLSALSPPPPSVRWVEMVPPVKGSYTSYLPCVRTSGWLLPDVTCYPTEVRTTLSLLDEDDPAPTLRDAR
jgi:hypothetical protein